MSPRHASRPPGWVAAGSGAPIRTKTPTVGVLSGASAAAQASHVQALRDGLRELGYVEGHTIRIEPRYADGQLDRLQGFTGELGCLGADPGPNFPDMWRRAAAYVDRILKGAKPADLPVEQPTRFDLVVNLRSARALGLIIPDAVLLQAEIIP